MRAIKRFIGRLPSLIVSKNKVWLIKSIPKKYIIKDVTFYISNKNIITNIQVNAIHPNVSRTKQYCVDCLGREISETLIKRVAYTLQMYYLDDAYFIPRGIKTIPMQVDYIGSFLGSARISFPAILEYDGRIITPKLNIIKPQDFSFRINKNIEEQSYDRKQICNRTSFFS